MSRVTGAKSVLFLKIVLALFSTLNAQLKESSLVFLFCFFIFFFEATHMRRLQDRNKKENHPSHVSTEVGFFLTFLGRSSKKHFDMY